MKKSTKKIINVIIKTLQYRTDFVVLGLSGGIDSTVAACLCAKAIEPENVYGYIMPYNRTDWIKYNLAAEDLARKLKINFKTIPINDAVEGYKDSLDCPFNEATEANLVSRIRTNILYMYKENLHDITGKKGLVIGTSNMTEIFVGDHVLGGDALGDIFLLGDLYKSEVYEIASYFKEKKCIDSSMIDYIPTSNLHGDDTTYDRWGYNYEQVEFVINDWLEYLRTPTEKDLRQLYSVSQIHKIVMDQYFENKHKHPAGKVIPLRHLVGN